MFIKRLFDTQTVHSPEEFKSLLSVLTRVEWRQGSINAIGMSPVIEIHKLNLRLIILLF